MEEASEFGYGMGMIQGYQLDQSLPVRLLSSSGPNVKVKSKLGPEIGFVMG